MSPEPGPAASELPPDFAERVLLEVDRVHRRRRWVGSVAATLAASAVLLLLNRDPAVRPTQAATLEASDFAWLEQVGAEPGDPEAMIVPDRAEIATSSEGDPLVDVVENI